MDIRKLFSIVATFTLGLGLFGYAVAQDKVSTKPMPQAAASAVPI